MTHHKYCAITYGKCTCHQFPIVDTPPIASAVPSFVATETTEAVSIPTQADTAPAVPLLRQAHTEALSVRVLRETLGGARCAGLDDQETIDLAAEELGEQGDLEEANQLIANESHRADRLQSQMDDLRKQVDHLRGILGGCAGLTDQQVIELAAAEVDTLRAQVRHVRKAPR